MIFAKQALLPSGWRVDVRIEVTDGQIAQVMPGSNAQPGDTVVDGLIPGLPNLHSHAFQRGFAGLTETRGTGRESFWSWREMMYRFALSLSPEDMQALAELAYIEMLEAGFTRVGEFHYLHHAPDGRRYGDPAEMSARIFAAAAQTGIALTHLPVLYMHGGFGGQPADDGQRRFLHGVDDFLTLVQACDRLVTRPQDRVGIAPHSLRAVDGAALATVLAALPGRPVHIHIAEQVKEVEDCLAWSGQRPVEWLYDHAAVDPRWCLIHATHLTAAERRAIAASGAVAGLCPVTEANLGDGIFPAGDFLAEDGCFGIGTDSNLRIDAAEELRLLEYGQRLIHRARNLLALPGGSTGMRLLQGALAGGAQALAAPAPAITAGQPADLVGLRDPHGLPAMPDALVDRWIFGREVSVQDVWAAGHHVVAHGRHHHRDAITDRAAQVLRRVLGG